MILSILEHTPLWVWVTFCAVITLGMLQIRTRDVSTARATVLPVVMVALSLSGVLSGFSQVHQGGHCLPGVPHSHAVASVAPTIGP